MRDTAINFTKLLRWHCVPYLLGSIIYTILTKDWRHAHQPFTNPRYGCMSFMQEFVCMSIVIDMPVTIDRQLEYGQHYLTQSCYLLPPRRELLMLKWQWLGHPTLLTLVVDHWAVSLKSENGHGHDGNLQFEKSCTRALKSLIFSKIFPLCMSFKNNYMYV